MEHWNGLGVQGFAAYSDLVAVQADAGLTTPPVPPHLASELRADRWSWSTTPYFTSFDVYLGVDLDRCLRARTGDFWVYGHNGHGINSYAIGLIARTGGLLVAQQHGFAGAYMGDNTNAVNAANTAWSHLLTQLNPAEHDCTVAVIFSEFRGYADILSSEDRYLPTSEGESLVDVPDGWALVVSSSFDVPVQTQLQEVASKGSDRMRLAAQHLFRLVHPGEEVPNTSTGGGSEVENPNGRVVPPCFSPTSRTRPPSLSTARSGTRHIMTAQKMTVAALFSAAQTTCAGSVRWGDRIERSGPGIYVIASSNDPGDPVGDAVAQISDDAVQELLDEREALSIDGAPATASTLRARLESMWILGSPVLYIGLAGTSLRDRVRQYYRTPIGARRPHAGGWPIKMLATLPELWVHVAEHDDPNHAERLMVDAFMAWSRDVIGPGFCDPSTPLPYANLTVPGGRRQQHGIGGARAARVEAVVTDRPRPQPSAAPDEVSSTAPTGSNRVQGGHSE